MRWDSSVGIVTWLRAGGCRFQIPTEARDLSLFSYNVQTGCGAVQYVQGLLFGGKAVGA
jgi:hypothetical protein